MTDTPNIKELVERLRTRPTGDPYLHMMVHEAADALEAQAAELAKCKTTMIAAAEEIHAHWDAHCDAEGYGPANLQRRLEEGVPAEYGYTAGRFAELIAERDAAKAELARLRAERVPDMDAWVLQALVAAGPAQEG